MLKRLIEVALPLKEMSKQPAREKLIWHEGVPALHVIQAPSGQFRPTEEAKIVRYIVGQHDWSGASCHV